MKKPDDDVVCIVCLPVAAGPAIPGSTKQNCGHCATPIWVSPATRRSVHPERKRRFLCMDCARKAFDDDDQIHPPTAEQLDELRRHLPGLEEETN